MDIERALQWAFREELPKSRRDIGVAGGIASGWSAMNSYAELLTRIDCNRYGVVPDLCARDAPDPDAAAIGEAVRELDKLRVGVPEAWNPIADLGDLGPLGAGAVASALDRETAVERGGERRFKTRPSLLLMHHAIMRTAPDWECERPKMRVVQANGKALWFRIERVWAGDLDGNPELGCWREIEVDGYNRRTKRPYDDAYRKFVLDPDPTPAIVERMEYEIWRAALDWVFDAVAGSLGMTLTRTTRPERAWEAEWRAPRIWRPAFPEGRDWLDVGLR